MGWVSMSARALNRVEVLARVDDGRLSGGTGVVILRASSLIDTLCNCSARLRCSVSSLSYFSLISRAK